MTTRVKAAGWAATRLDRVATVKARIGWKALTAAEYVEDGYAFLSTPNIKGSQVDFERVNYITEARYLESPELMLQVGDVLLAKDGNTLGIVNHVTDLPGPATVNGSIAVIRARGIESRFLYWVLRSATLQGRMQEVREGMGVPHLFQYDINRFWLPLPSRVEQQRIADFLDDQVALLDRAVTLRQQQAGLLEEQFEARREVLIEGSRNALRVPLGLLIESTRPINYGVLMPGPRAEEGVPIIEAGDVMRGPIQVADLRLTDPEIERDFSRSRLRTGDLVMAIRGSVGRTQVVPPGPDIMNVTRDAARISVAPSLASPGYVRHALATRYSQDWLNLRVTGSAVKGINIGDLRKVPVSVVPAAAQEGVADQLDRAEEALQHARGLLSESQVLLAERKQALISASVTGEFDVTTARKVPVDV